MSTVLKIDEVGTVITGKTPKTSVSEFWDGNLPFYTPSDMDGRRRLDGVKRYITEEGLKSVKNSVIPPNSVMVSCIGSDMGKVSLSVHHGVTNQQINTIIPNEEVVDFLYLYYSLLPRKSELQMLASGGSAQPILNKGQFSQLEVVIPSLQDQKAIAHILGTLDDKIELNQKMNQTLEDIAKAIFKSWFVDFDPVRAKAEGRPTGLPTEISDLFPDELVASEIGEMPKGWSVGAISDFAFLNKKTVNPSQSSEIYEHFSIPAFDSGQSPVFDLGTDIKSNKTLVVEGSLLVSKLNPNTPRVWLPNPKELYEQICSTEFMVYTATDRSNIAYLWGLFTGSAVTRRMEAMVTGTSKSHQRVKPNDVSSINTIIPDTRLIEQYEEIVLPMLNRTLIGKSESTVISQLRDTLLPKLISGELRIPEAEKFLEEAGI